MLKSSRAGDRLEQLRDCSHGSFPLCQLSIMHRIAIYGTAAACSLGERLVRPIINCLSRGHLRPCANTQIEA